MQFIVNSQSSRPAQEGRGVFERIEMKVQSKYLLSYSGEYNKSIFICPDCRLIVTPLFDHIKGFYKSNMGLLFVAECPKCFKLFSAHSGGYYKYFLDSIKEGTNLHFKEST